MTPGVLLIESMAQAGLVALGLYLLWKETPPEEAEKLVTVFIDANVEFTRQGAAGRPGADPSARRSSSAGASCAASARCGSKTGRWCARARSPGWGCRDERRVVVTGLGVIAPNGNGLRDFELALRKGSSGLRANAEMQEAGFACQVAGVPQGVDAIATSYFAEDELLAMNSSHRFASIAAVDAWQDAGLARPERGDDRVDWDSGAVLGTGIGGMDTIAARIVPLVEQKKVRRLGSTAVEQVMASGISARVSGLLALGNQVTTNSSACSTGTEAIAMGAARIRSGLAERMLCGGAEGASHYIWAGFDAMRVLARGFNDEPEKASRPLSASAAGFIPGAGAGVLLLESLDVRPGARSPHLRRAARLGRELRRPPRRRQHDRAESRRACAAASAPRCGREDRRARRST